MVDSTKKALNHTLEELGISGIRRSIEEADYEKLRKAHDSIHEFMTVAYHCVPPDTTVWHSRDAFMCYQYEAFYQAHRALLETLAGYYNAGYSLLRNELELLLKGAFWECMAHKEFRKNAEIIKKSVVKIEGTNQTLLDWFEDIFKLEPSIEEELENNSVGIFDKIAPIFKDLALKRLILPLKRVLEQLDAWNILDPIPDGVESVYNLYGDLSNDIHVIPDRTDIGRRIDSIENLFEITILPKELDKFSQTLHSVMDIGIVIELNILDNWIRESEDVKSSLRERLPVVEDLQLSCTLLKLRRLLNL